MQVVILGAGGAVGETVARTVHGLSRGGPIDQVVVADYERERADDLADDLGDHRGPPVKGAFVDATDPGSLRDRLAGADAAAGAVGPFSEHERRIVEAAIDTGTPYASLCDDRAATLAALEVDDRAREAGVTVVPGIGWAPGLSNLLAAREIRRLREPRSVKFSWAGSAEDSGGDAALEHVLEIHAERAPRVEDGEETTVPAGSDPECVTFPAPLGDVYVYGVDHPEPSTFHRVYPDLPEITVKGGLTETPLSGLFLGMGRSGIADSERRRRALTRALSSARSVVTPLVPGGPPLSGVRVDVEGIDPDGDHRSTTAGAVGHLDELAATPLSVMTRWLANETVVHPGVHPPETPALVGPDRFLEAVSDAGVRIRRGFDEQT